MATKGWRAFVVDLLVGAVTAAVLVLIGLGIRRHEGLLTVAAVTIGVAVTTLRANRSSRLAWLHGLMVGLGIGGPVTALVLFESRPKANPGAWVFLISSLVLCCVVAEASALFRTGRKVSSVLTCVCGVVVIALLWTAGLSLMMPKAMAVKVDKALPELALQRMDGTPIALSELQGHVTVMDFWGTWCPGCVEEMPVLKEVAAGYSGDSKVQFLLVNPEMDGDEPEKIRAFVQKKGIAIPVALDPSQSCFKLGSMLFPTTLVIDRRGHVRLESSGYTSANSTRKELRDEVDELLKE